MIDEEPVARYQPEPLDAAHREQQAIERILRRRPGLDLRNGVACLYWQHGAAPAQDGFFKLLRWDRRAQLPLADFDRDLPEARYADEQGIGRPRFMSWRLRADQRQNIMRVEEQIHRVKTGRGCLENLLEVDRRSPPR